MGLSATLGNALSGMNVNQKSLDVLSRNVSNSGTPGYHRQSLTVIDNIGSNSTYVRSGQVERAFSKSLEAYYTRQVSDSSFASVRADFLDRLQTYMGKVGAAGSLDTQFNKFKGSLQSLSTSPDSYTVRAEVVSNAQALAETLNRLSNSVQGLRQEAEGQISDTISQLNQKLSSLSQINIRILDGGTDQTTRATMMDQRDRLVAQVSELIDVQVDYRENGTVALSTRSGVGLLDQRPAVFDFEPAGKLSPGALSDYDPLKNGVGTLNLRTPSGMMLNLVSSEVLQSGKLGALVELRDNTLVETQGQLDEIASALAQAFSTVQTEGTPATVGAANGYDIDLSTLRPGNDVLLRYSEGGVAKTVRIVRVDDASKLPMDYVDTNGSRVLGYNSADGMAAIATQLGARLPSLQVSASGSNLRILDDGNGNVSAIDGVTARTTATDLQNGKLGFSLFVDSGNADFTNSLAGDTQRRGFAGRISINTGILANNQLLVQAVPGATLGDASRVNKVLSQLNSLGFASGMDAVSSRVNARLSGTVGDFVSQTINYQGTRIATAIAESESHELAFEALDQRMQSAYGVKVDEEMARLMELQNAYAANARVVSIVKELLDSLMQI